jgi:hypothetical protein
MRIKKIKGYKNCVCCGIKFSYFNSRRVYCGKQCELKYRLGKERNRKVSLAYIPERFIEKEQ